MRRCIEKETGKQFAAKIIDLSNDTASDGITAKEATKQEVAMLRLVAGHPYISSYIIIFDIWWRETEPFLVYCCLVGHIELTLTCFYLANFSLVELQDVFESSTFIFLVFELCKNGELFDYLTSVVTLSEKKTKYIMRQIFEGVAHIRACGIVHRDLKPENILLDDNLNVKITDFGFAKKIEKGEQLHGKSYDFGCRIIIFDEFLGKIYVAHPDIWHRKRYVAI